MMTKFLVLECSVVGEESMTLMEIDISMENHLMDARTRTFTANDFENEKPVTKDFRGEIFEYPVD